MSATTHDVGAAGEFGDGGEGRAEVSTTSSLAAAFDASTGDDWGTVLAVAVLIVGLIFGVLLLGGS